ncbi:variant erythrocyte surface antigen-1 family protein [Babesia caballi]|uniref:Variant erythrocyte surface antigen-1 family protein n=1 Tax=Babesia caballi TaxID=5871 RepID=A0AAV4LZF6_BABCB|nr:variant erythrocyte surface antigen-1 family protein [Babesia caballi]
MGGDDLLKKPPENLKDAIDWILWFWAYGGNGSGMNKYEKLAEALKNNQEFADAKKQALGQNMDPQGVINKLATNLGSRFMGYASQGGGFDFNGSGIIQNGRANYTTKYKDATWNGSKDSTKMARIFLGATAITF